MNHIRNVVIIDTIDNKPDVSVRFNFTKQVPGAPLPDDSNGPEFLIQIVHTPAQDIRISALRHADGALVVVDCVEGLSDHTKTVLLQALSARIVPVINFNGMDKCFLQGLSGDAIYHKMVTNIENVNAAINVANSDVSMVNIEVGAANGTVSFSAGLDEWAFTLPLFGRMYAKKFGIDEKRLTERLWGDNFFDPEIKKWSKTATSASGVQLQRGFVQFIIEPMRRIYNAGMSNNHEGLMKLLGHVDVKLSLDDLAASNCRNKALVNFAMQSWLPADRCILEMMVMHLPSPPRAQPYRAAALCGGSSSSSSSSRFGSSALPMSSSAPGATGAAAAAAAAADHCCC